MELNYTIHNCKIKATRHTPSQNYLYYHHTASSS